ncbi:MAG: CocE/NonD family hydrolase [Mesorhizobium sp.]|uniref:CocE/NonD family hydrolase n=1 Tax=Mesorhizobium sp. TaxID=1871066 RepID=UPI000FE98F1B|nr:CocE/NonD family hydrolase [Mesorhizobium sp.]RWD50795.1 MAG: CocE/NonD family hydrolase [Mesorhizobium sp.]RWE58692.1 MAG: CocE/NonD family hydrolase [Mesorhizobium sp.]RWF06931.1 MAG: CocE/NonD family hydrolase [Mesorhizobium sp.]RWF22352.1 MAG: CocE/NonD family hydrolase [Mesorhizobium sp.]
MKAAEAADFTETDVIRDIGYVAMNDATRMAYISYRPKKPGQYPTAFLYDPYIANSTPFEVAKEFLDAGYAFVGANLPGTGCSEGVIDFWHEQRMIKGGPYGAELVEWIARQPWSDGNIGMVGNSSAGQPQFWVAAERPPHLRAIVASGFGDGYEFMGYCGGMLPLAEGEWVIQSQFVTGPRGAEWRIDQGDAECAKIRGSDRQVIKTSFFDMWRKHPLKDEWWESETLVSKELTDRVTVPSMIIGGWQEAYGGAARANVRMFTHFMQNVKNKKLVLMNGDHGINGPGPRGYSLVDKERMKFLDRWVKGVENGIENEPPITVYWEVQQPEGDPKKSAAGWMTHHNTWPDPNVERRTFYLTADAQISPEKPGASPNEGSRAYLYPTGTELYGDNQQFQVRPYSRGVLNYRTAPLTSDMVLLGNPEVVLYLSIDNGDDADVELTLKDVGPDGVLFVQSGVLRASLRAIDNDRTYVDEVVHSFRKSEKLVPGEIYELRMSLISPIAHVVRQGHSLELTIGATNPIPHSVLGSIPAGAASINRVYHSAKYASRLILPVIPEAVAQAPAPAYDALRGQPFRRDAEFVPGGLPIQ